MPTASPHLSPPSLLQRLSNVHWGQSHPRLRTTVLSSPNTPICVGSLSHHLTPNKSHNDQPIYEFSFQSVNWLQETIRRRGALLPGGHKRGTQEMWVASHFSFPLKKSQLLKQIPVLFGESYLEGERTYFEYGNYIQNNRTKDCDFFCLFSRRRNASL